MNISLSRSLLLSQTLWPTLVLVSSWIVADMCATEGKGGARAVATSIGRPVRLVCFSFRPDKPLERILSLVDAEGARGTDLIVLPETWRGQNDKTKELFPGPTIKALAGLARKHGTYIVAPIDTEQEGRRFNTAVVIDRTGEVPGHYNKAFPFWSEFDHKQPVCPGGMPAVLKTDFGKVGLAICFDVNFPEVWRGLEEQGAELVLWPSAYSAGAHLQAYSLVHHYYIATATQTGDCQVYDITGHRLLDERGDDVHISRITLDLDRGIYHTNFNEDKKARLLKEHAGEVAQEPYLEREQWFVLKALKPGVSARALAKQYGLEELRDYINRSRREINKMRESRAVVTPSNP